MFWLWPARVGLIIYAGSDFPHPFQFCFSKESMGHTVQNQPGSDLDGLARVWLNSSDQEASWCAGMSRSGFHQVTTSPLSVSHFWTRLLSSTDVMDNTVQNQPRSYLVLADCARFWPNRSGPEESKCARIIQSASGQHFPADLAQMQTGSGMFTG